MMRHHHIGHPQRTCPGCYDELEEIIAFRRREKIVRVLTVSAIVFITGFLIVLAILGS
jgi:hypothetical protein